MSAEAYLQQVKALVARIESTQQSAIRQAALHMAGSIAAGRAVHLFGSGHSVIPVLDIVPRHGSFVGFHPIMDPRLMWCNVVGPGGARELLWLERTEGYVANVLLPDLPTPGELCGYRPGGRPAGGVPLSGWSPGAE